MSRVSQVVLVAVLCGALVAPANAQIPVYDFATHAETILLVRKTITEYERLVEQYNTIVRMSRALGNIGRYRTPPIAFSAHDTARFVYGAPWLNGLNAGDANGALYAQVARLLQRLPAAELARLPPAARRAIQDAYATIEITDSIAQRGAHQVALVRGFGGRLQNVVQILENDVLNPLESYHQVTSVLDKVAVGELVGRRQDTASNQLLSHALEQLLAQAKRKRDTEVATMNMRLAAMRDAGAVSRAYMAGSAEALRTWRQP
jgi:hypothetical protein